MTEKEKMLAGKIYDPMEEELKQRRIEVNKLCLKYNNMPEDDLERQQVFKQIFPQASDNVFARGPVFVDYGSFTKIGKNTYFNFNLVILDVCPVTIGENVYFGPNISILTAMHPFLKEERYYFYSEKHHFDIDYEYGKPINIGNDCWIGGNVTILPGVTIHDNVIVGAGSVVTHDLDSGAIYAGNPAKKIRDITKEDSIFLKKELW